VAGLTMIKMLRQSKNTPDVKAQSHPLALLLSLSSHVLEIDAVPSWSNHKNGDQRFLLESSNTFVTN
jgi:hypothetical protein